MVDVTCVTSNQWTKRSWIYGWLGSYVHTRHVNFSLYEFSWVLSLWNPLSCFSSVVLDWVCLDCHTASCWTLPSLLSLLSADSLWDWSNDWFFIGDYLLSQPLFEWSFDGHYLFIYLSCLAFWLNHPGRSSFRLGMGNFRGLHLGSSREADCMWVTRDGLESALGWHRMPAWWDERWGRALASVCYWQWLVGPHPILWCEQEATERAQILHTWSMAGSGQGSSPPNPCHLALILPRPYSACSWGVSLRWDSDVRNYKYWNPSHRCRCLFADLFPFVKCFCFCLPSFRVNIWPLDHSNCSFHSLSPLLVWLENWIFCLGRTTAECME